MGEMNCYPQFLVRGLIFSQCQYFSVQLDMNSELEAEPLAMKELDASNTTPQVWVKSAVPKAGLRLIALSLICSKELELGSGTFGEMSGYD